MMMLDEEDVEREISRGREGVYKLEESRREISHTTNTMNDRAHDLTTADF